MEKEYGTLTKLEMQLVEEMEQISVIDCHEHLVSEEQRTGKEVDVFTLFSHYTRHDLINSGMPAEKYNMLHDKSIPLEVDGRYLSLTGRIYAIPAIHDQL